MKSERDHEQYEHYTVRFMPGPSPNDSLARKAFLHTKSALGIGGKILATHLPHQDALRKKREAQERNAREGRFGKVLLDKDFPHDLNLG